MDSRILSGQKTAELQSLWGDLPFIKGHEDSAKHALTDTRIKQLLRKGGCLAESRKCYGVIRRMTVRYLTDFLENVDKRLSFERTDFANSTTFGTSIQRPPSAGNITISCVFIYLLLAKQKLPIPGMDLHFSICCDGENNQTLLLYSGKDSIIRKKKVNEEYIFSKVIFKRGSDDARVARLCTNDGLRQGLVAAAPAHTDITFLTSRENILRRFAKTYGKDLDGFAFRFTQSQQPRRSSMSVIVSVQWRCMGLSGRRSLSAARTVALISISMKPTRDQAS